MKSRLLRAYKTADGGRNGFGAVNRIVPLTERVDAKREQERNQNPLNADNSGGSHAGTIAKHREDSSQMRGLGDVIHRVATAIGVPTCGGCEKRRQQLNKLVPFTSEKT